VCEDLCNRDPLRGYAIISSLKADPTWLARPSTIILCIKLDSGITRTRSDEVASMPPKTSRGDCVRPLRMKSPLGWSRLLHLYAIGL
jgi:hypothetical protein